MYNDHIDSGLQGLKQQCQRLLATNKLRQIDVQLAEQLLQYERQARAGAELCDSAASEQQDTLLYLVSLLVSAALAKGQVCLPLDRCPLPELIPWWPVKTNLGLSLEGLHCTFRLNGNLHLSHTPIKERMAGSIADTDGLSGWQNQPLIIDDGYAQTRLYLARYYVYEMGVYQAINTRLQHSDDQLSEQARQSLKDTLAGLFPDVVTLNEKGQTDWQNIAAASACLQRFTVITGGPGTGKTTTVTRLLSALLSQAEAGKTLHIALAAPTGKAAARMTESIRAAKQRGNLANAEQIPDSSFTLHRLLGWSPRGFRYHRDHPLPYDCVVVDEASMIDLPMMFHLMTALAANTRLILLGDRDQLASVEAGSVLADLCDAGNEHAPSAEFSQRLSRITGQNLQVLNPALAMLGQQPGNAMQNALAQLRVSHRFTADSGIGQLAAAVNAGEVKPALACFNRFDDIDLQWLQDSNARSADTQWQLPVMQGYRDYCQAVRKAATGDIIAAFAQFQVLVATRQGTSGVEYVNERIEQWLRPQLDPEQVYTGVMYPGRALMIARNDYDLGLFNGDIGIVVETGSPEQPQLKVAFQSLDGDVRLIMPSRLPEHETAFAMTVHKSQGSEFDRVFLMLPQQWQSVITRELIYTAITRAKQHFRLLTSMHSFQTGVVTRVQRASGLRDRLWQVPDQQ